MKITELVPQYLRELKVLNRSPYTIKGTKYNLRDFVRFLDEEQVCHVDQLTAQVLTEYQHDLAFRVTGKGTLLNIRTQESRLSHVRGFTKYLHERDFLVSDPGIKIKMPKQPQRLPRNILSSDDIQQMLSAADMRTNRGYRNRVILELLYDTGIRRLELARIKLHDLDLRAGYACVHGKGSKDRIVPVSNRVCGVVQDYITGIRPAFLQGKDSGYLILNRWGGQLGPDGIWAVVKRCAVLAGIKKNISTHTFRHSCATHMLQNGAPIRHIQELLGHESLESTQIYTRVTITDLKEVHARYHPSEKMKR